ncbi:UDP-glucose 4-epimerase GalE [Parvularcula dongshanensis]|uniref:UDP-glucose 4-epimerase n=1 Tax=Parvularcula dongshanensis TaxID=1173995 RepID=A0A840I3I4_9PROT|nr:UDP-glucose 4-epimerase GalE [Parvularcula dongshanensis]MBB4658833.1 UDP-glucose 4-epimerase [Parvularcula dongshanensis]
MTDTILITGGAGYIGSHAAWACADRGYKLVVLDDLSTGREASVPDGAELVLGDVADEALVARVLKDHKPRAVMHFAGRIVVPESVADPIKYYRQNTCATLGLLAQLVEAGTEAMLFSSTAAVYEPREDGAPLAEDAPKVPLSPYGQSKLMTEAMMRDVGRAHGLSAAILRYFNVAGADPEGRTGQSTPDATHLIKIASQVAVGQRDKMQLFGDDYPTPDGTCVRDYIHVTDLAEAHVLALEHVLANPGQVTMNCGYGRGSSVKEVIRAVERCTNEKLNVEIAPRRPGDAPALVADVSRIHDTLDWTPKHDDLEEMARSAMAWERKLAAERR